MWLFRPSVTPGVFMTLHRLLDAVMVLVCDWGQGRPAAAAAAVYLQRHRLCSHADAALSRLPSGQRGAGGRREERTGARRKLAIQRGTWRRRDDAHARTHRVTPRARTGHNCLTKDVEMQIGKCSFLRFCCIVFRSLKPVFKIYKYCLVSWLLRMFHPPNYNLNIYLFIHLFIYLF